MFDAGHPELMLYDNLEGQGREGGGRRVQDGVDTSIPMADSYLCMAKTISILWSNYPPIKINICLKKKEKKETMGGNSVLTQIEAGVLWWKWGEFPAFVKTLSLLAALSTSAELWSITEHSLKGSAPDPLSSAFRCKDFSLRVYFQECK